jgi:hypothetical protein
MAAQIEPTTGEALNRSISTVYRCVSRPDLTRERAAARTTLRQFLTEAPRTMRPKRRAGASITA